jgi:hypothetical protein
MMMMIYLSIDCDTSLHCHKQYSFTVPEDASRTNLHPEFVLPHPAFSPDISPSDFHIFGPLTNSLLGRRFADEDELKHSAREEL